MGCHGIVWVSLQIGKLLQFIFFEAKFQRHNRSNAFSFECYLTDVAELIVREIYMSNGFCMVTRNGK